MLIYLVSALLVVSVIIAIILSNLLSAIGEIGTKASAMITGIGYICDNTALLYKSLESHRMSVDSDKLLESLEECRGFLSSVDSSLYDLREIAKKRKL